MHHTAMETARRFFQTYAPHRSDLTIVDVGALDVNGSLRHVAPADSRYIGLDFATGPGVDIVIDDPYALPLPDASADIVVCSSCFEHSEHFWLLFNEVLRLLRPDGLFYLSVPSNGLFHRYPVDCWRFYPDSGRALQSWGRRSGYAVALLESFTEEQTGDRWNDFVAVFVKDEAHAGRYPARMIDSYPRFRNGLVRGSDTLLRASEKPEDQDWQPLRRLGFAVRDVAIAAFHLLPAGWQEAARTLRSGRR